MKSFFALYFLLCTFLANSVFVSVSGAGLREEFTWTRINYVWPRQSRFGGGYRPYTPTNVPIGGGGYSGTEFIYPGQSVSSGVGGNHQHRKTTTTTTESSVSQDNQAGARDIDYVYENNIPMGANVWKDKLFITVPRRRSGVPATLNYVPLNSPDKHNQPLNPYPTWENNLLDAPADERLVSIYRVAIDPCDRLWAIDTGIIEVLGNRTDVQRHSIVIIDLNTDKIIKRYTLKESDLRPPTILAMIAVDVTADSCDNAFAYMPDLAGYGLIVYSLKADDSWRVNHNYFYLEPLAGDFNIGGNKFQWNDGVFSVALSQIKNNGFRDVYFHSMAGTHLYKVGTNILRNQTAATRNYHENDFKVLGDRGPMSQTSATDLHKASGVLFFSLVNQNALGCWNTNKQFLPENFDIVQRHDEKMIYPCDLKIAGDDVVLLTNNMPIFLYSQLNYDQINFRVWINSVSNAISSTKCALRRGGSRPGYGK